MPPLTTHVRLDWGAIRDHESRITQFALANFTTLALPPLSANSSANVTAAANATANVRAPTAEDAPFLPVGESPRWMLSTRELPYNASLAFRVHACNTLGLCTTSNWSRGVRRVALPPTGGIISGSVTAAADSGWLTDGYAHLGAMLRWNGAGFSPGDDSSALAYETCIGTTPFGCQLLPFRSGRAIDLVATFPGNR